jgi:cold shock CspA family protein
MLCDVMTTNDNGRKIGIVRRWYEDRGFGFLRALITKEDGTTRIDASASDVFVHISQLKKSGLRSIATNDVVYFDEQTSPRTGKIEAANVWPAK